MQTNKLLLLKQTLFLTVMLVISYWTIIVYNDVYVFGDNMSLFGLFLGFLVLFILITTLFVFTPLTVLFFLRLKKGGDLRILNKVFRITSVFILIMFIVIFILTIGEQLYWRSSRISFWVNLQYLITYHLSWEYFRDINYGFIEDVKQVLVYLPHIIIAFLLYLAYKANKLLATTGSRDMIK